METWRGNEVEAQVRTSFIPATTPVPSEEEIDLRRGPWTVEEDLLLMNYINNHGDGRWNSLARSAECPRRIIIGLRRTGKSCRLRWLNYLRPGVRRGNIIPEEQVLILELHSRWGNRWSKIAKYLPGRTDNEIKNYWRTRVQKQAKQLRCDVDSKQFQDLMRYLWMPRLLEKIRAAASGGEPGQMNPRADSSATAASSSPAGGDCSGGEGIQADQFVGSPGGYADPGWLPDFDFGTWSKNIIWSVKSSVDDIWLH